MRSTFLLLLRAAGAALPIGVLAPAHAGCIGSCDDDGVYPSVALAADVASGPAPLRARLTATGTDGACACSACDDEDRIIREFRWDLDGDGDTDEAGATLTKLEVTVDAPGQRTVHVTVVDADGNEGSASIVLEATDS